MKLSAPTQLAFLISLVLAVLGMLSGFGIISAIGGNTFYVMVAAWGVLTAGVLFKGF